MKNIIESQITATEQTAISALISDLETALSGKTGSLDAEERTRYGSVSEQNKLVVNKAREYRQNQPAMSAPDIDWAEFESDYQSRMFLENVINRLKALVHDLESTKIMHDYGNFQDALHDYSYSQYKHGTGESGYATKVEEYKQFFTRLKKNNSTGDGGTP